MFALFPLRLHQSSLLHYPCHPFFPCKHIHSRKPIVFKSMVPHLFLIATLLGAHNVAYHFYAVDTQIYIRIDSIEDVKGKLSSLINDIKIWMNGRKLTVYYRVKVGLM